MGSVRATKALATAFLAAMTIAPLAGCGTPERVRSDGALQTDGPSTTSTSPAAEYAADPSRAVQAPGKFDGVLFGDDLLLVSQDTITDDQLEAILGVTVRKKPGVAAHERISYGQFSVENELYNIAAVDPASYRRFNGPEADFDQQWDRLAGGEVAVAQSLQKELSVDDDGLLAVGREKIHVGSWFRSGVDGIDALVNKRWGEAIGLPENNAVLLNTGLASPQVVREKIEKAVGSATFSIIALDAVQQAGIDLSAIQSVVAVGDFRDAVGVFRYSVLSGGRIAPDRAWVESHIVKEAVPILGVVTCNRYMMPQLKAALGEIQRNGLGDKIHRDQYAGCYYPRFIAGSTKLSNHSFGLALDLNVPGNQRGTVGQMDRRVVAIFKRWGFAWGGDWAYTDPMHFELNKIVNPG